MGRFVFPFVGGFPPHLRLSLAGPIASPLISPRLDSDSPHPRSPAGTRH